MKAESAALAFAGVMTIGFLVLLAVPSDESPVVDEWEITSVCLDGHDGLATHIHATLSITIHSHKYSQSVTYLDDVTEIPRYFYLHI